MDINTVVHVVAAECGYDFEDVFTVVVDNPEHVKTICIVFKDGSGTIVFAERPDTQ